MENQVGLGFRLAKTICGTIFCGVHRVSKYIGAYTGAPLF